MTTIRKWLDRPIHPSLPGVTYEVIFFAIVILLAVLTRFYDLESRVMSHDESLHTYFSWLLYRGQGYEHTPMMHGPLQFHLIALSYFLFGVSDFTSRIPAALFSIATIWMVWYWRRYLGKTGALIAALLMVVSPYMLYYGRYVRNEAYAGFAGILMLYAILRYLETGGVRYLTLVTVSLIIHFAAKETSFIYAAQALMFLGIYFVAQVTNKPWKGRESQFRSFLIALIAGVLLLGGALGYGLYERSGSILTGAETAVPANPNAPVSPLEASVNSTPITGILGGMGALILLFAIAFLISGYSWKKLRAERSFGLIMLIGTLTFPLLTPLPIKLFESWLHVTIPSTAGEVSALMTGSNLILGLPRDIIIVGLFVIVMFTISILIGQLWSRQWWQQAVLFWGLFVILFTAIFTNSDGFFTGLIGSLGYWLVQQGVQRGSQPWYFYILIQIPVYEFLPALGTLMAAFFGIQKLAGNLQTEKGDEDQEQNDGSTASTPDDQSASASDGSASPDRDPVEANFTNTFSLLLWWIVTSIVALSYAGERMPWLTYHMAWPMILMTGWGLGYLIENINWKKLLPTRTAIAITLTVLVLIGLFSSIASLVGPNPPFQGKGLDQLQATNAFLLPAIITIASIGGLTYSMKDENTDLLKVALAVVFIFSLLGTAISAFTIPTDPLAQPGAITSAIVRLTVLLLVTLASLWGLYSLRKHPSGTYPAMVTLTVFFFLLILTTRAAFRAAYITYDSAAEYLVYAHGAGGIKQVMAQAEEISRRTTGGLDMALAYDASAPDTGVSWPFVWYLRDFTNLRAFDQPTKSLRESSVVVVDAKNFDKIEPALGPGFYRFDYIRMWWPNQDYFGLTKTRIADAIRNPQIRAGIWDIWFDRDYTRYAQATGHTDLTQTTWQPADLMRMYVRKDVAAQIWNYGAAPSETVTIEDPTEGKAIILSADLVLDGAQSDGVWLQTPREITFAADGSFYVADSGNHRIVHFDQDGNKLGSWGTFGDNVNGDAPPGTFNEPWGVAVGPDGSVYVTDTWNHRVQKFSASGKPLTTWGQYGTPDQPDGFWGPRGIAVDSEGFVYIADTGNKRIVVFDSDGNYQAEFGTAGLSPGQFDEPVGVAIDRNDVIYVADTWNQRVQTFTSTEDKTLFFPERQWDVFGWFGQSLDNKPFLAVNSAGHVFVTDPEQYRVIEFSETGEVIRTWGDFGDTSTTFGLAAGIAIDPEGHIWVTDALNNRILRFTLP